MDNVLEIKDLATYFYTHDGVVKAVDGISYEVQEGETLGIVGESGCGKSVSALSIMRLIADPPGRIERGEVIFEGRDLLKLSDSEMRTVRGNRIGMIFQEPMTSLNPVLTIERQLTETLELHLKMTKMEARSRAGELIEMVGIPDPGRRLKDYPHQMSGGMRQRIMIAMAISCNPRLIIADEPTTALDVTIQAQFLRLIRELQQEKGTSVIWVTHDLGIVAQMCDRVNVMYAGRIVESAPVRKIYKEPQHPYTKALLDSVPVMGVKRDRLSQIEGQPPDLRSIPTGCPFWPRCDSAMDICKEEYPPRTSMGGDDFVHCWLTEK